MMTRLDANFQGTRSSQDSEINISSMWDRTHAIDMARKAQNWEWVLDLLRKGPIDPQIRDSLLPAVISETIYLSEQECLTLVQAVRSNHSASFPDYAIQSLSQAVMAATKRGFCDVVKELLAINESYPPGFTDWPLQEAVKMKIERPDLVRALLPYTSENSRGLAGIKIAILGKLNVMLALLEFGPIQGNYDDTYHYRTFDSCRPIKPYNNRYRPPCEAIEPFLNAIVREATRWGNLDIALEALRVDPNPISYENRSRLVIAAAHAGRENVLLDLVMYGPIWPYDKELAIEAARKTGNNHLIPILEEADVISDSEILYANP